MHYVKVRKCATSIWTIANSKELLQTNWKFTRFCKNLRFPKNHYRHHSNSMKSVGKETNQDPLVQNAEEMVELKTRIAMLVEMINNLQAKIGAYEAIPTASTFAQSDLQYWRDEKLRTQDELILLRTKENILLAPKQGKWFHLFNSLLLPLTLFFLHFVKLILNEPR